ncbi:hypothetical protein ANN_13174 [Periplaneta americana]|uniref:Uncharacterized protein n=1 Tax=Periplaneta americana TaxID=6978 RepID=A0ABQ8TKW7_PERAM|nr:hypothetical protein ANN_13174 [Periplaneta americana]
MGRKCSTYGSGRQHSLKCAKGMRCRPVCPVVQQEEIESIPASSYECTMVRCVFRGSGRQHSLKCAKGMRCRPVCPVVQQEEIESIPASSYECTMLARETFYIEDLRHQLLLPATEQYVTLRSELRSKKNQIWDDFYTTHAMTSHDWKRASSISGM